jgi:hypothetical protein
MWVFSMSAFGRRIAKTYHNFNFVFSVALILYGSLVVREKPRIG